MHLSRPVYVLAAAAAGFAVPAQAAPQILALLETSVPVALNCNRDLCTATLSSYCLQVERYAPVSGMKLYLAKGGKVTLVIRDRKGFERRVDASAVARFASERKEYAVRISVPRSVLGAKAQAVSVQVGKQASLVPESIADDPQPHTPAEIHRVTTHDRVAGQIMEQGSYRMLISIAQALNRITNRLDRGNSVGRAMLDRIDSRENVPTLLTSTINHHVSQCRLSIDSVDCLKKRHDNLLLRYNLSYWRRNKNAGF
ncbi:MAG: hypothetical protein OXC54_08125 [Rhodospirillaceae bacterium]|nr:hypothetical protein [Rhodospirillaceae bacterium]MCY4311259.1 hypothetical protein [Rhodospirillaceae bacterium]